MQWLMLFLKKRIGANDLATRDGKAVTVDGGGQDRGWEAAGENILLANIG